MTLYIYAVLESPGSTELTPESWTPTFGGFHVEIQFFIQAVCC